MTPRSLAPAIVALIGGGVLIGACRWDGPEVQVAAPASSTSSTLDEGAVDVPVESLPPETAPPIDQSNIDATPEATVDLSGVTLPAGGRRPLPANLPATIAVVGDSLTLSATDEIRSTLTSVGIDVLAIDGAERRRMTHGSDPDPGIDSVDAIADHAVPAMWVVALGTNDIGDGIDPDQYAADVERLLDEIPSATPVVWVDVWIRDRQPAVERANEVLRDVLAQRPGTIVADWFSRGDDDGLVGADGVHLTADGRQVFAATILSAVLALAA